MHVAMCVHACCVRVCVRVMHACMCMRGGGSAGVHGCQHTHICQVPKGAKFNDIFVSTFETVQTAYLADVLLKHNIPILVSGNTGTGKTIVVNDRILALDEAAYQNMNITFSAQTSARITQDLIDSKLDKRRKGVFGPPFGKRCIIFVDDLNMPMLETCVLQRQLEAATLAVRGCSHVFRGCNTVSRSCNLTYQVRRAAARRAAAPVDGPRRLV